MNKVDNILLVILSIIFIGIVGHIGVTVFNSENTTADKVINKHYQEVHTETKEHTGIRVSEGSGGDSRGMGSNYESNMVIKTDMLDIEVSKDNLEVISDNDKAGTYEVMTYEAYPKLITSGLKEGVKKYIAYVPE